MFNDLALKTMVLIGKGYEEKAEIIEVILLGFIGVGAGILGRTVLDPTTAIIYAGAFGAMAMVILTTFIDWHCMLDNHDLMVVGTINALNVASLFLLQWVPFLVSFAAILIMTLVMSLSSKYQEFIKEVESYNA